MYDILIKNGEVVDGSGRAKYKADVAVLDGRIAKIGKLENERAKIMLEADGLAVAPGFIDVLSHSDAYLTLFTVPGQESVVSQGITTIIGGNCGYSLAPLAYPQTLIAEQRWTDNPAQINVDWLKMGEFLECLKGKKIGLVKEYFGEGLNADVLINVDKNNSVKVDFYRGELMPGLPVYFVSCDKYFGKKKNIYVSTRENARFYLFSVAALKLISLLKF